MKATINKFLKVGIIVRSVDDAVKHYEEEDRHRPFLRKKQGDREPSSVSLPL